MSRCLKCGKYAVWIDKFCGYWCEDDYEGGTMSERTITIKTVSMNDDDFECMISAIQRDQGALIQRIEEQ